MRAPCKIKGCEKESRGRGWCGTHWLRWRKYGDPLYVKRSGVDFNVRSLCAVGDCGRPNQARGMCGMHYSRWRKHGDPLRVDPILGRPLDGDVPTFAAIHKRLSRSRGAASRFECVDCGCRAKEWSYNNAAAREVYGKSGDSIVAYSLDLSDYDPRCVSCHRTFDGAGDRIRNDIGQFVTREAAA